MFSKKEASEWNQRFYTAFGIFMRKHQPQSDYNVRWLNYNTGVKNIFFRVEATKKHGMVSIDIQYQDSGMREIFFNQFVEFERMIKDYLTGEWVWDEEYELDNGKVVSRIYIKKEGLNLYKEDDWSAFFHFFEKHLLELDSFWTDFKDAFIELAR